ncbi:carbohydrate binding domain-containing protein [Paenibacillus glycanilyticus]|uniref:carbohydrate binding domain-containing protein n=1 Tax=Paenibacillus glycanilyticus TaxID=126569 RepID=UPI00203F0A36|nr:carbohydrate binding domain-containing protein [Paenibacillus glycanilyticus]MCM3629844.1 carbohydrate binding domain-containing protein [Paenibacillus glycanilyticus]
MKNQGLKRSLSGVLAIALMLASLSLSILPKQADAEASAVKLATDFEDGTVQGWHGRGGNEVLSAAGAAAHTGTYGLQVTGRSQSWNGPQLDVTSIMTEGKIYALTAWVKVSPSILKHPPAQRWTSMWMIFLWNSFLIRNRLLFSRIFRP